MIGVSKIFDLGYPHGIALYEVSYAWRDLPDHVKAGEEDHVDYVTTAVEEILGRGEWLSGPLLGDGGVWVGIFRPFCYHAATITAPPLKEIPLE